MLIITGRISKFLHNSADEVDGIALDTGIDIHFSPNVADRVSAIATADSLVELHARLRGSPGRDVRRNAVFITNVDSKRSASLEDPTPDEPEELAGDTFSPRTTAPLAPSLIGSEAPHPEHPAPQAIATRNSVADEMEQAHDALHRTQAMLACVTRMKQEESSIYQYLNEAQHTYVQALSRYQARDFEGAREFAEASSGLSRAVEILISRSLYANTHRPKLGPPSQEYAPRHWETPEAQQYDLDRIESMLARIHWITENGTLPSEDRTQVQKLSSWSESLYRQAHHLLGRGAMEDAIDFALAADATACSAEHLCKKCYVTHRADVTTAAG